MGEADMYWTWDTGQESSRLGFVSQTPLASDLSIVLIQEIAKLSSTFINRIDHQLSFLLLQASPELSNTEGSSEVTESQNGSPPLAQRRSLPLPLDKRKRKDKGKYQELSSFIVSYHFCYKVTSLCFHLGVLHVGGHELVSGKGKRHEASLWKYCAGRPECGNSKWVWAELPSDLSPNITPIIPTIQSALVERMLPLTFI